MRTHVGPVRVSPIRVLIVDDSALVRHLLSEGLARDELISVVGTARDPYEARDLLVKHRPDVMTLDLEMPRMDGLTFLQRFMTVLPTPTIVLSSLTTRGSALALQALELGAVDVVAKPSLGVQSGLVSMMEDLIARIKMAATVEVTRKAEPMVAPNGHTTTRVPAPIDGTTDRVIGLGASTGGVAALGRILPALPAWTPGVVVVQHMPAGFTRDFADRLNASCPMSVAEARDGDRVMSGQILVAPGGNRHLEVRRHGGEYRVHLVPGEPVNGHIPSVDVMFESLANHVGTNARACLLTGMGADGAKGLRLLRDKGGRTFAQDRETCAVWGMPAAAEELGAAERFVPLHEVPAALLGLTKN